MTRVSIEEPGAEQLATHRVSTAAHHESICARCGGLMVNDFCMDVLNNIGESRFDAKRCVQCGEVVDPVILENRGARQEPMAVQVEGRMRSNNSRRKINTRALTRQSKGGAMKPEEYSRDKEAGIFSPTIGGPRLFAASPAEVDGSLSSPRKDLSSR